jgi:hypothetical protein
LEAEPESLEPPPSDRRRGFLRRRKPKTEDEPVPELALEPEPEPLEPAAGGHRRGFLRRRKPEPEPIPPAPPRHVKLLPRRSAPEPSRAGQEVEELFDSGEDGPKREERGA